MNRKVIAVLVCTLLALIAATVWVPLQQQTVYKAWPQFTITGPDTSVNARYWGPVWHAMREPVWESAKGWRDTSPTVEGWTDSVRIRWWPFAQTLSLIVAAGGLLTLFFRTLDRRRRRRADRVSSA